jgi:hypothetical protein
MYQRGIGRAISYVCLLADGVSAPLVDVKDVIGNITQAT